MTNEVTQDTLEPVEGMDTSVPEQQEEQAGHVESGVKSLEDVEKLEELAKNQKIRAEKAEKELKRLKAQSKPESTGDEPAPKPSGDLSAVDILALTDVKSQEDREFLIEKSKEMSKSISDLLKDEYMQAALNTRAEQRKTAEAANTAQSGGGRRGATGATDEQIVTAFNAGKEVDPVKLAEAQLALRKKEAGIQS